MRFFDIFFCSHNILRVDINTTSHRSPMLAVIAHRWSSSGLPHPRPVTLVILRMMLSMLTILFSCPDKLHASLAQCRRLAFHAVKIEKRHMSSSRCAQKKARSSARARAARARGGSKSARMQHTRRLMGASINKKKERPPAR